MSVTSKVALGLSFGFTAAIVTYVHVKQKTDRERMREGVILDIKRQQHNLKMKNVKMLQDQIELTKILRREQEQQDAASQGSQQQ